MPEPSAAAPVAALVLAAGKSTRMKSKTPKSLHLLMGRPVLKFVLDAALKAGAARTIVVVGHQADAVQSAMGPDYEYALQVEQNGTGHAVQMARSLLADWPGPVLVLPGDAPLISSELLHSLLAHHAHTGAAATLLTARLEDAGSYGRIVRDPTTQQVQAIVEAKDASTSQLALTEINSSVYAFDARQLFDALAQITTDNAQGELYLTDAVARLVGAGARVEAVVSPDSDIVRGVNTRVELAELSQLLRARTVRRLQLSGVTITDPLTTLIDDTVNIGEDTTVYPFTILSGTTDIGANCEIGPGARVSDSRLGDGVVVRDSYVVASDIGDDAHIGPFANIRPGSVLGKRVKIGDFVELKAATLGDDAKANHLSYIGDAEVGARVNIGAGVITCNFDPFRTPPKNKTIIGADAFIGTHSTLVAPVTVGDDAFTAAGSVITDDVPPGALALARARQTNKDGWVAKRRRKGE